jgi:hypothetical protein
MFFLAVAGGLAVGAVIVFVGVWMVQSWNGAGRLARSIMLILLAVALGVAWLSFFKAVPANVLPRFGVALLVFLPCLILLGVYRVRRKKWAQRPGKWGAWLLCETGRALFLPMAIVVVGASVMSTIAFFAAMQKGPQAGPLLFELSIVTAACWAVVTVGGVWASGRTQDR